MLNSASDVASVPVQITYDPAKLALVNVAAGDLLNRDGQAVALIHRDDGPGNVTVVASRPPGHRGRQWQWVGLRAHLPGQGRGTNFASP